MSITDNLQHKAEDLLTPSKLFSTHKKPIRKQLSKQTQQRPEKQGCSKPVHTRQSFYMNSAMKMGMLINQRRSLLYSISNHMAKNRDCRPEINRKHANKALVGATPYPIILAIKRYSPKPNPTGIKTMPMR